MKFSKKGYLKNSPDVNKPQNIIKGGNITMKGVDFKVHGVDNNGYAKVMTPGYDYSFPNAEYVIETPIKNKKMNGPFKMKPGRSPFPKTGKGLPEDMTNPIMKKDKNTGKVVEVTTKSGKKVKLDTRSAEYKSLMAGEKKKEKDLRSGKPVFDKSNVHYTGLTKN
jgi:hypothetical protein